MCSPKILVCVDFDNTLVDCNTDVEIKKVLHGKEIPEEIESLSKVSKGWTAYMRELFKFLHKSNITKEDYIRCLTQLPMVQGMKELLLQMYESGDCEIIILSDANSFFVQTILRHHQVNGTVSKIFTNPAEFDKDGCLQIKEFQNQTSCTRCPPNLCKGSILGNYISKRMIEGVQFCRTLYIGDGHNDVCAALRLGVNDFVFARAGYRLLRSLEKMPAKNVKPTVVPWETVKDIRDVLLSS
ncbi:pyridoxal phosphate phosphatase PHOSPHO2-like [Argiope bruennichi]|uniref:Pyridoxal phosphate phosphatase PHOSPHO2 like protein n=1 Tax=Argiope bruennichi TaxID=94029 RepID=A0A8T0E951_ARGBR|nr:pyridoxal phosphate phosphatase PHOSPHO2-like [Argiope bruennichi]KAF8768369.1 Pyridoxal phosphate phosphatase PHOSPHO2 like protein [Argiope bruennichi]